MHLESGTKDVRLVSGTSLETFEECSFIAATNERKRSVKVRRDASVLKERLLSVQLISVVGVSTFVD